MRLHIVLVARPRVKEAVGIAGVQWYRALSRLLAMKDVKGYKTKNYKFAY